MGTLVTDPPPTPLPAPDDPLQVYLPHVGAAIVEGRVIPFLGAGVNQCGRPPGVEWLMGDGDPPQVRYPPTGRELAEYLARCYRYQERDVDDLLRVSEFVAMMRGEDALYDRLRTIFNADYPITRAHQFLAVLPSILRERGSLRSDDCRRAGYVVITTNYDDVLERAFSAVGESVHVFTYMADGEYPGQFRHHLPSGEEDVVPVPSDRYDRLPDLKDCTVLLKIHGAVDRREPVSDSFVITEDHYIEYLTRTELRSLLPVALGPKLAFCHFLFLGYSLRDWNFRAIFQRLRSKRQRPVKSWAIQKELHPLDQKLWIHRDVDIIKADLGEVIERLASQLGIPLPIPLAAEPAPRSENLQ